jgi:hypothetical protein
MWSNAAGGASTEGGAEGSTRDSIAGFYMLFVRTKRARRLRRGG